MTGGMRRLSSLGRHVLATSSLRKNLWESRCLSSSASNSDEPPSSSGNKKKVNSFKQPPLSSPASDLAEAKYAEYKESSLGNDTKVTVLPNGLRIASENKFGQFCTIGVIIESGSRYEVAYPSGISHFLEKLAFHSTSEYSDKDKILHTLEKHGGICDCLGSRDTFVYASSVDRRGYDTVVQILSETVLRPRLTDSEIELASQFIRFEYENLMTRPEQEVILMDLIHAAAYRDNTLGLPKICPPENVDKINRKVLMTYLQSHYVPNRMVIAGVGIDHDQLVESVQKHFVENEPIWGRDPPKVKVDESVAQYTGGIIKAEVVGAYIVCLPSLRCVKNEPVSADRHLQCPEEQLKLLVSFVLSDAEDGEQLKPEICRIPVHLGPTEFPELAHVVIGLEGVSHQDPDFIAMCVLSVMMGGGGSFSAGGPGKGMYTRLYTNVLNRHPWMFSATAYNQNYVDTGLFYIHASAPPSNARDIVEVISREMVNMAGSVSDGELRRAKTQLQSMILMNLEARPVLFEDIARQVLAIGKRKQPAHFIQEIENITKADIERIALRLLKSQPSVAARGDVENLQDLSDIQASLSGKEVSSRRSYRTGLGMERNDRRPE